MLADEPSDDGMTRWGPLALAALAYVAVGAWDWTDTVEALARYVRHIYYNNTSVALRICTSILTNVRLHTDACWQ